VSTAPANQCRLALKTRSPEFSASPPPIPTGSYQRRRRPANDKLFEVEASGGGARAKRLRNPVQFNLEPVASTRAPQASQHTEVVLVELGLEWDHIEALKTAWVTA
jgi:crotonobetainyl-CoA:carnitine CoA-transferase CaiB-like acyl-CoA transferase